MRNPVLLCLLLASACHDVVVSTSTSTSTASQRASGTYADAVEAARAGDEARALAALDVALAAEPDAVQRALLEPAFADGLRDTDAFRAALRDAAIAHGVTSLSLAPDDEPGERVAVELRVVDRERQPVPAAVVYVFGTDVDGLYHPSLEGESTPRLFGTLVTDDGGVARIDTVRPGPYPGTRDAIHLHVGVRAGERRLAAPRYIVFDDDPLLFEAGNEEQRGEALRVAMDDEGRAGVVTLPVR